MEVDEVESISSSSASPPHKELTSPQSDRDKREMTLEDSSPKSLHSHQTPSPSLPADQEKIILSDKDGDTSSADEEFMSPPDSNSQLNEIEFEPQVEQSDNSQEQVIKLTQRTDSPIIIPNTSQQDSSSNYSPPRASSSPSSSNDLPSPSKEPVTPLISRSVRSAGKDSGNFSRGQLVWAKVSGFRFWPGLVVDAKSATSLPSKLRTPYREGWLLIHFFGTYDYAWVPPKSCIVSWYLGNKKGYMNKCKSKFFQLGLGEANRFQTDGSMPVGFSAVPQVLESGSESDSIISVDSTEIKPINAKRKLSGSNIPVVSIKKMKLSDYQASNSSQDSNLTSEQSRNQRERKRRCEIVMKRLGLAPPDKYLGRKLPKKVNTNPGSEL